MRQEAVKVLFLFFFFFFFVSETAAYGALQHRAEPGGKEVRRMEALHVPSFQQFCDQTVQLRHRLSLMQDGRPAPQISAGTVAEAICFMGR